MKPTQGQVRESGPGEQRSYRRSEKGKKIENREIRRPRKLQEKLAPRRRA